MFDSFKKKKPNLIDYSVELGELSFDNELTESIIKDIYEKLERAARTCYLSHDKIKEGSAAKLIKNLRDRGHFSVFEHGSISYKLVCSRAAAMQFLRHRIGFSYSMQSQRYVNHNKKGLEFIRPYNYSSNDFFFPKRRKLFEKSCILCEKMYNQRLEAGEKPEDARGSLNNDVATTIFVTANLRALRNMFKERCTKYAQAEIRTLSSSLLVRMLELMPEVFGDLEYLLDD